MSSGPDDHDAAVLLVGVGDLGTRIGLELLDAGHRVIGMRRTVPDAPSEIDMISADITDRTSIDAVARHLGTPGLTVVFTVTAGERTEAAYQRTYVDGMALVIDVLRPARVVSVSSTAVYDINDGSWVDESTPVDPSGFSGRAMLAMEQLAAQSGAVASSVRLGGVYGPGRTRFVDQVRTGSATFGPNPTFTNRIHVDDAARLVAAVAQHSAPPGVVVGVDNEPASRREVIEWLAGELGVKVPPIDPKFAPVTNKRCRNDLSRELGFQPLYPSYREGYAELLAD